MLTHSLGFAGRLAEVHDLVEPDFVRPDWAERNATLEQSLLPRPPRDFLRRPEIAFQMFVGERYVEHELPYVLERLPSPELLDEDPFGDPPTIRRAGRTTSSNTIHHLHHLLRWEDTTGRRLADADTIVEWGAGYGNLAKLAARLHGDEPTYVLIDTPVFSAIQWLYLSTVLGEDRVVLHTEPGTEPAPGRMNVVPLGLAAELPVEADVLVSTWALNESTPAAQRLVLDRDCFGADGLLIAMHRGDPLEEAVLALGTRAVALGDWMPGQHYFVR